LSITVCYLEKKQYGDRSLSWLGRCTLIIKKK